MTQVYGVTKFGGREQIGRQLKDLPGMPWQDNEEGDQVPYTLSLFLGGGSLFRSCCRISGCPPSMSPKSSGLPLTWSSWLEWPSETGCRNVEASWPLAS